MISELILLSISLVKNHSEYCTIIGEVVIRTVCSADSALFRALGPTPAQPGSTSLNIKRPRLFDRVFNVER